MTIKKYFIMTLLLHCIPVLCMNNNPPPYSLNELTQFHSNALKIVIESIKKILEDLPAQLHQLLRKAAVQDDEKTVTALINQCGIDINQVIAIGDILSPESHLHNAARIGNIPMATLLLKHNANIDIEDDNGETPLFFAIRNKQVAMVQFLVEHNANMIHEDYYKWTPLKLAKRCNVNFDEKSTIILAFLQKKLEQ